MLVSSQPHINHLCFFLIEVLVKKLHSLVKAKSQVKPPYTSHYKMANHSQFGFQDASSPIIEELVQFHDHAIMVALAICSLVLYLLILIITEKLSSSTVDAQEIELV